MLLAIGGTASALVLNEIASSLLQFNPPSPEQALRAHSSAASTLIVAEAWKVGAAGPTQVC